MRVFLGLVLLSVATAAPAADDAQATITDYNYENDGSGKYEYRYDTSNGLSRFETGEVQNKGQENEYILVKGRYSYFNPEGQLISVSYTADEHGYHIDQPFSGGAVGGGFGGGYSPNLVASILGG